MRPNNSTFLIRHLSRVSTRLLAILLASGLSYGQTIVENPKKPANKGAGRTVKLVEKIRIRDDGREIVFKYPDQLQVGDDGGVFFACWPEYLKYDAQGRLIYRIVKSGQGPGESGLATRALMTAEGVFVQSYSPPKVMRFSTKGDYLGEDRIPLTHSYEFVTMKDGRIYAFQEEAPDYMNVPRPDYYEVPVSFCILSPDLKNVDKPFQFPYRWYLHRGFGWQQARFDFGIKDLERIYVVHGIDYRVDHYNAETNKIEKTITRKYDKVKRPLDPREQRPDYSGPPPLEFYYDISKVLVTGDLLWVITSTRNESQSRLVDVFDAQGRYVDCFFLEFPPGFTPGLTLGKIVLKDGFLYTVDEDAEGFFSIGKYEILDPGKRSK
jgi:hypothetical protein